MKAVAVAFLSALLFTAPTAAFAEACAPVDDANKFERWAPPVDAALRDAARTPKQKLARVLELLANDPESDEVSLRAKRELSLFIVAVLQEFDGPASANSLGTSYVTPDGCTGEQAPGGGIPAPPCAWTILGDQDRVDVPLRSEASAWPCAFQRRYASYVRATVSALKEWSAPHIATAARSLRKYDKAWKNLITDGYSQYPWEVWLNGLLIERLHIDKEQWGPPDWLLIAVHPAVGAGVASVLGAHGKAAEPAVVLSSELLGGLYYFSNHSQYVGLGATLTLNNLQWDQRGLGAVLHVFGFSLGMSHELKDHGSWTVFWLVDVTKSFDDSLLLDKAPKTVSELL